jgi:hypothetical protein
MGKLVFWLDRKFYPGVERNRDDSVFRERIVEILHRFRVLLIVVLASLLSM